MNVCACKVPWSWRNDNNYVAACSASTSASNAPPAEACTWLSKRTTELPTNTLKKEFVSPINFPAERTLQKTWAEYVSMVITEEAQLSERRLFCSAPLQSISGRRHQPATGWNLVAHTEYCHLAISDRWRHCQLQSFEWLFLTENICKRVHRWPKIESCHSDFLPMNGTSWERRLSLCETLVMVLYGWWYCFRVQVLQGAPCPSGREVYCSCKPLTVLIDSVLPRNHGHSWLIEWACYFWRTQWNQTTYLGTLPSCPVSGSD